MSIRTVKLALAFVLFAGVSVAFAHSAGPSPGYTGAPGEFNCRQCHNSFALNDGIGSISIEGVPETYEPGETYTITVRVERPQRARWGFQMTALTASLDPAGTFQLVDAAKTQLKTDDGKTYVEHKTAGTNAGATGGNSWSVRWVAPPAGTGVVDFYAAGNASNNNNAQTGDNIYTTFAETGEAVTAIPFTNVTAASGLTTAPGGSGIAWADFDGDGDQDLFVAGEARDRLYRNSGGSFAEAGASLGLPPDGGSRAAAWGDFDGDARPDLFLATAAGPRLYRNTATGFADVTAMAALPDAGAVTVGAWVDYDGDGRLDLFAAYDGGAALLHNEGDGTFADVTATAGLAGLTGIRVAAWADYDGDGHADLFAGTASDAVLYRQAGGAFSEVAGVAPGAASDAVWADYDGDGRLDLFVATGSAVRLLRNDGGGELVDATSSAGLSGVSATTLAVDDSNGDGGLDLLASGAGGVRVMRSDGTGFTDATADAGITASGVVAATWADATGDGHVDLLTVSASGVALWRNPSTAATIEVRAVTASGSDALGSVVALDARQAHVLSGGGSAAQPPARAIFSTASPQSVVVRATFPSGVGREATTATASTARVSLAEPDAPRIESVSYKLKSGTDKLLVDGAGFVTNAEVVEVDGSRMDETKYPKKKRLGNGTSSRVVGTDASFSALVPRGRAVLVTTFDPTTGVRSAPFSYTRP